MRSREINALATDRVRHTYIIHVQKQTHYAICIDGFMVFDSFSVQLIRFFSVWIYGLVCAMRRKVISIYVFRIECTCYWKFVSLLIDGCTHLHLHGLALDDVTFWQMCIINSFNENQEEENQLEIIQHSIVPSHNPIRRKVSPESDCEAPFERKHFATQQTSIDPKLLHKKRSELSETSKQANSIYAILIIHNSWVVKPEIFQVFRLIFEIIALKWVKTNSTGSLPEVINI